MRLLRFQPFLLLGFLMLGASMVYSGGSSAAPPSQAGPPSGFRALTGGDAAGFGLPGDVELVRTADLTAAYGLLLGRYQQFFGSAKAEVLGAQLSVYRDANGRNALVIGAHYPQIVPANSVVLSRAAALTIAERDIGPDGQRVVDLVIDPTTGRYQFRVETRRFSSRWFHFIDARSGQVLAKFDAIHHDHGTGVKGDTKSTVVPDGNASTPDSITRFENGSWNLTSEDGRQKTFDARNCALFCVIYDATDSDNHWLEPGRASPGQGALFDAQYYASVTDDYYGQQHGLNWLTCYSGGMRSVAHYGSNYNNAFWNGTYVVYGDGDGTTFREFSGALDVVAHELTHAVTDCFSKLTYSGESGALNEAFSDIMGSNVEFFADEPTSSNCVLAANQSSCADWWIAEDVYLPADSVPGFRNMADPLEDGDPDHYTKRFTGTADNGGVHTNSGIPNHAYYLLVNGGQNASCAKSPPASHCVGEENDAVVEIGLSSAERIFFLAFNGLPSNATMCQARLATEATAETLFGGTSTEKASTRKAWVVVGLTDTQCGVAPAATPTPTSAATDTPQPGTETSTPTAAATDTPTSAPTATDTPEPTNTPPATITPLPTNTPTPTSTPATATMHVGDLDGSSARNGSAGWRATVNILVHDGNEQPLSGVAVSGSFTVGGSKSCTTGTNGRCSVTSNRLSNVYTSTTFSVSGLSRSGYTYVSGGNHDPDADSDGTTIVVARP